MTLALLLACQSGSVPVPGGSRPWFDPDLPDLNATHAFLVTADDYDYDRVTEVVVARPALADLYAETWIRQLSAMTTDELALQPGWLAARREDEDTELFTAWPDGDGTAWVRGRRQGAASAVRFDALGRAVIEQRHEIRVDRTYDPDGRLLGGSSTLAGPDGLTTDTFTTTWNEGEETYAQLDVVTAGPQHHVPEEIRSFDEQGRLTLIEIENLNNGTFLPTEQRTWLDEHNVEITIGYRYLHRTYAPSGALIREVLRPVGYPSFRTWDEQGELLSFGDPDESETWTTVVFEDGIRTALEREGATVGTWVHERDGIGRVVQEIHRLSFISEVLTIEDLGPLDTLGPDDLLGESVPMRPERAWTQDPWWETGA
ncbi:MAG: hypothetical protein H6736_04420 [Alphaproteobacteria bacterium]|nr:hypothetical protein [Alphaproteobacteria bacterium]